MAKKVNLNVCPCCEKKDKLGVYIDAYDTNYEEDEEGYDTSVEFLLDDDLVAIKEELPKGVYTYDKDRCLTCSGCGKTCDTDNRLWDMRVLVREKNPGLI